MEAYLQCKGINHIEWCVSPGAQGVAQGVAQGEILGRLREGRELIYALGRERLGEPSPEVVALLEGVTSPDQYPALIKRVAVAASWSELFPGDEIAPRPPKRRKSL